MTSNRLSARLSQLLLLCALAPPALALSTDLANVPLITSAPQVVLPNLMYVLDDSGSMAWTYLPDDAGNLTGDYGYVSYQCNGVYYNPNIVYTPPVSSTGVSYSNSSFTAAWSDGYNTSAGTVNLSSSFQAYTGGGGPFGGGGGSDTAQPAYYYKYSGTQTSAAQKDYSNTSGTFYQECSSAIGSTPGSGVFTKVVVGTTTGPGGTNEQTNFANWYSYYRNRMSTFKTSASLAFNTIGSNFRVGYMTINDNQGSAFLDPVTFDATGKAAWYAKLFAAVPGSSTPLRVALATAGQYFAHLAGSVINDVTVADPIQYSCQRNYAIMSTDGYWNENSNPTQLDGSTAIGNQDSSEPRPFNDGGTSANVYTATISISGSSNTAISSIMVGSSQILNKATTASTSPGTVATAIATAINKCSASLPTSTACTVVGYKAVKSGSTVTITAPSSAGALSSTPVVTQSGGMTLTVSAFSGSAISSGGTSNTLADVAEYYYKTDLRTAALGNNLGALGTDVSANNVPTSGVDIATWQHMTTFTIGLGARGRMVFSPTYQTDTSGDYYAVANGQAATSTVCTWQTAGTTCNWPTPGSNLPENIDDLWHAAVNGRGTYFSATDPASLSTALNNALQQVNAMTSDAAAATTSNPNITAVGENFIFSSTFRSVDWYGDLERRAVDNLTGQPAVTADWDARPLLDTNTSRTIYTFDPTNTTTGLRAFLWANLTAAEQAYFSTPYIAGLTQFCSSGANCLSATTQASASGSALLNFLRGDRTNEGALNDTTKYFRQRTSVLGDIVDSEAVYVQTPQYAYSDTGYAAYVSSNSSRAAVVYVGANDGMLHAFNAGTAAAGGGTELWAYIPLTLLPNLYVLADKNYSTNHHYFVDGSPTQADVYYGGAWHTILVGGYNAGGRGYYALDVTNPSSPKALWEVNSATTGFANMGYTFGRPQIGKLLDGTWAVFVTSGYNNVSPGDGGGYLYVLNASTGAVIRTIATGQGSASAAVTGICTTAPCPSGLAQVATWTNNPTVDNTVQRVYGGDLFGNVWRFDVNNNVGAAGYDAQQLATLRGPSGNIQSVTATPELGLVAGYSVVYVGTGRYLGASDLSDTSVQSIYAIKDNLGSASLGNPRATGTTFVAQTLTNGLCPSGATFCVPNSTVRTGSSNPVNFAVNNGWYVDLPGTGERATTDPQLALGTLTFTTNVLNPSACAVGGKSFVNFFDYRTGAPISTAGGVISVYLGAALATRPVELKFSDGSVRSLIRMSDGTWQEPLTPIPPTSGNVRRTSWRELVTE